MGFGKTSWDEVMGVENFPNAPAGSKRSAKRARVLLAAKLQTTFGEVEARLRDLSRKGALVECAQVPNVGSDVIFVRGETVVPARVAWAADNRVGLEFEHMIDEHELLVHIGKPPAKAPAAAAFPKSYRRPGLGQGMSADDRKVAQAWSVAVGLNLPEGKN
jgi:hypothetical protein